MGERSAADGLLPAAATVATAALLLLAPVLPDPSLRALGRACSEAPAHLWGLWVAADGLEVHGPLLRDAAVGWPGHFRSHLIDPVHLAVFVPVTRLIGGPAGAVLAWNLLHLLAVLLGGLGSIALGRRLRLGGWPLGLLTAAVVGSPALLHHPELGRSEYLPAMGLPLVLAGLWDAARGGRLRRGWLAGLGLGAVASSGPTLALFLAPVVGLCGLAWTRDLPLAPRLRVLASVALPGLLGAGTALWAVLQWPPPHASDMLGGLARELVSSADLPSLLRIGPPLRDLEHTPYLGLVPVSLGLYGLWRDPRRVVPWAGLVVLLVLLAIGPLPRLGATLLAGPVSLLTALVPALGAVSGWPRAAWLLGLPLGVCAAVGLAQLGRHQRWLGPLLIVALLTDHARYPPPRVERRGSAWFAPAPTAALLEVEAALPPGPLFTLPAVTPASGEACAPDAPWLLWGQALDRPVSANQGRPTDGLAASGWLAAGLVRQPEALLRSQRRRPVDAACVREQIELLHDTGVVAVVVDDRLPRGSPTQRALEVLLGVPHRRSGAVSAWELSRWLAENPQAAAVDCPR